MKKFHLYDASRNYIWPNMHMAGPAEFMKDFPTCLTVPTIVETNEQEQVCYAVHFYGNLMTEHGLDPNIPPAQGVAILNDLMANPPVEPERPYIASPEERIAAALEFNNLLLM